MSLNNIRPPMDLKGRLEQVILHVNVNNYLGSMASSSSSSSSPARSQQ